MTRNEYMKALSEALQPLPETERGDILSDYEEHFALGAEGGKTEAEIAAALGDPYQAAQPYLPERRGEDKTARRSAGDVMHMVGVGMLFVLSLAAGFGCFYTALWTWQYVLGGHVQYVIPTFLTAIFAFGLAVLLWVQGLKARKAAHGALSSRAHRWQRGARVACIATAALWIFFGVIFYHMGAYGPNVQTASYAIKEPFTAWELEMSNGSVEITRHAEADMPRVNVTMTAIDNNPYAVSDYYAVTVQDGVLKITGTPYYLLGRYDLAHKVHIDLYVPEETEELSWHGYNPGAPYFEVPLSTIPPEE